MKKFLRKILVFILQKQAVLYFKINQPQLVAVIGQVNRSNIKDEIFQTLLCSDCQVRKNLKGYNADIGLPLTILNLNAGFSSLSKWFKLLFKALIISFQKNNKREVLVLEISVGKIDQMEKFLTKIQFKALVLSDFLPKISHKKVVKYKELINLIVGDKTVVLLKVKFICSA